MLLHSYTILRTQLDHPGTQNFRFNYYYLSNSPSPLPASPGEEMCVPVGQNSSGVVLL